MLNTNRFGDNKIEPRKQGIYSSLKKLFASNVVVRNVGGKRIKIVDTEQIQTAVQSDVMDRYAKLYSTRSAGGYMKDGYVDNTVHRKVLFRDYECLIGSTIIPLVDGRNLTIEQLSKIYDSDDKIGVYSYDIKTDTIVKAIAFNPRYMGQKEVYKVSYSDDEFDIATADHPFLTEKNEYVFVKDLMSGMGIRSLSGIKIIQTVQYYCKTDVYDMSVPIYHNFATKHSFVHNCMEQDPIIASALDLYADECSVKNEYGDVLMIKTNDDNIKQILENLFFDILNINFNIFSWIRSMCKYGDLFLQLQIEPDLGVYSIKQLSAYDVTRLEGEDSINPEYVKFLIESPGLRSELESFEVAHFRLLSDGNFLPYGRSVLEPARRAWKQLTMMIDAMLIHRIMRAPEKRLFKLDVGALPPNEIENFVNKASEMIKKVPYIDQATGEYNLRFNLQNMTEDYVIPVRGSDSGTSIENLGGFEWTGTDDINMIKDFMLAALKVPRAFLNFEEGVAGKATMASQDLRFGRTIDRIQRIFVAELYKIAILHLYTQGFRNEALVDFELELSSPSLILEEQKTEVWNSKVGLAKDMMESKLMSRNFVYKELFKLSDKQIEKMDEELLKDSKTFFKYNKIQEEGLDPDFKPEKIDASGEGEPASDELSDLNSEIPSSELKQESVTKYDRKVEQKRKDKYKHKDDKIMGRDPLGTKELKRTVNSLTGRRITKNRKSSLSEFEKLENLLNKIQKPKKLLKDSEK